MVIKKVKLEDLSNWDKNPRGIKRKELDRLKEQIKKLGVYKPLVVCKEGDKYIVLGGNMRLRALRELGVREVEISVVEAKTDRERMEYALSDNDRVGYYEEDRLAEAVYEMREELDLRLYKVDLGEPKMLAKALADYVPDEEAGLEEGEVAFTEELLEEHNYIVLYFDNTVDWLQAKSLFDLKNVKSLSSREGYVQVGVGRVLKGREALERLRREFYKLNQGE